MQRTRNFATLAAVVLTGFLSLSSFVQAQTYPTNNPTYIPTAIMPQTTLSAAGYATMNLNGISSVVFTLSGSPTTPVGTFEGAAARSPDTVAWTTLTPTTMDGSGLLTRNVTATGVYRLNTAGLAQVRFNLASVAAGSIVVSASGQQGVGTVLERPLRSTTYSATVIGLTPAASATDLLTVTGSASVTIKIREVRCSGSSTANATALLVGLRRNTANSGGTSSAINVSSRSSAQAAASGTAVSYTANPTTGTLGTTYSVGLLTSGPLATPTVGAQDLFWRYGDNNTEMPTLNSAAQSFSINANGASFTSGMSLNCQVVWTEE